MISNLLFASLTLVAQQWWTNPLVHNVQGDFSADEQSCFLQMIRSQDKLMANEPTLHVFILNTVSPNSAGVSTDLDLFYGSTNEAGYYKQGSNVLITTSSPQGWVVTGQDETGFAFQAADMGRYANVVDAKTKAFEFQMDLTPCQQFFGITNQ
jgi:hypothetical protein